MTFFLLAFLPSGLCTELQKCTIFEGVILEWRQTPGHQSFWLMGSGKGPLCMLLCNPTATHLLGFLNSGEYFSSKPKPNKNLYSYINIFRMISCLKLILTPELLIKNISKMRNPSIQLSLYCSCIHLQRCAYKNCSSPTTSWRNWSYNMKNRRSCI